MFSHLTFKRIILLCCSLFYLSQAPAQIIWIEDFSGYPNQTTNTANWTTNANDCDDGGINTGGSTWGTFNGEFLVNDVEGFNCVSGGGDTRNEFTTINIDISASPCVQASIDLRSVGSFECDFPAGPDFSSNNGHDQIVVEYSIDGGAWIQFETDGYICGAVGLPTTATTVNNLSGNTIQIRLLIGNKAQGEDYFFDNITVTEVSNTYTLDSFGPYCSNDPTVPLPTTQDGVSGSWSGTGVSGNVLDPSLVTGSTTLTFTPDPGQCAGETITTVTVNSTTAITTTITACDDGSGSGTFDLTAGDLIINGGTGDIVIWYENSTGSTLILNPAMYPSSGGTVYAAVNDGTCESDRVPINLVLDPAPTAVNTSIDACDDGSGQATVDLTALDNIVNDGTTNAVSWFEDIALNNAIATPAAFVTGATTVYAEISDGLCTSVAEVSITINPSPTANSFPLSACDEGSGQATFDLTSIDNLVNGGSGLTVNWYEDMALMTPIATPASFLSSSVTIYATVENADCESTQVPIILTVDPAPIASPASLETCPLNTGEGQFNLTLANNTVNGGTGNTVTWFEDAAGNNLITIPGSYVSGSTTVFAQVNDGNCPSTLVPVTLTVVPPVEANIDLTQGISCPGDADGAIELIITSGTAPFTITWSDPTLNGLTTATNLAAGVYSVTVVDDNSCEESTTITLFDPTPLSLTCMEQSPVSSIGGMDGEALLTFSGGNDPYSISWSGPANGNQTNISTNTFTINNLPAGDYTVTLTDNNGCMETCTFTISAPACILSLNIGNLPVDCNGQSTGAIGLAINDGTEPYTITWSDPSLNGIEDPFDLPAGNYSVTVEDAAGCVANAMTTITEPSPISLSCAENLPVSVVGGSDGQAIINFSGGVPPYDLFWNGPISGSQNNINGNIFAIDNLPAGTYTVNLVDDNSCLINCIFAITEPSCNLTVAISGTDLSCEGDASGTIDVTINNGIAPFTITWNDASLNGIEDPNGLAAGTYTVNVEDAAGCSGTNTITLNAPNALTINCTESNPVSTIGGTDGQAAITLSGGTQPYAISWSGPTSGAQNNINTSIIGIDDLAEGTYTIDVIDANGCTNSCSVTISGPTCSLSLNITGSNLACNGDNTGSIELDILNGTGPFTITWNDPSLNGIEDPNGLAAGSYSVEVLDGSGCTALASVTLTEPNTLSLTCGEAAPTSTVGGTDGQALIEIFGGTAPYNVNWIGPVNGTQNGITNTSFSIDDLPEGNYSLNLIDDNGCTNSCTFNITGPSCSMTIDIAQINVGCAGEATGEIDVTINNGAAPFTITWNDASLNGIEDPTNLTEGNYIIDVVDAAGCTATASTTITQPPALTLNCSESNPVSSVGGNDGQANINITGGTSPYEISWSGSSSGTQNGIPGGPVSIDNLLEGTYDLNLTDANGCMETCSFTINGPSCNLSLNIGNLNVACNGEATGAIGLAINDGTEPYTITWSDPTLNGIEDPTGLAAGMYAVTVEDAAGCTATAMATITEPGPITLDCAESSPVSTVGGTDGQATINFTGGEAPYELNWFGAATGSESNINANSFVIDNLIAGSYTLNLVDDNNCLITCSFTITEPTCNLTLDIAETDLNCADDNSGAIDITINNGTEPYTITWNDASLNGTEDPSNLAAGAYTVEVEDANGCTATASTTIEQPPVLTLSCSESNPVSSVGGNDGQASIEFDGGTSPYVITWTGPVNGVQNGVTNSPFLINDLEVGTYQVDIADANGCRSNCTLIISGPSCSMTLDIEGTDVACTGDNSGAIELTINDGTAPFTISWNEANLNGIEDPVNLPAGNYTVDVTDAIGCTATASITINEPTPLIQTCTPSPVSTIGGMDGQISVEISGGTAPYQIIWIGAVIGNETDISTSPFVLEDLPASTYLVEVVDANGCISNCNIDVENPACNITLDITGTNLSCNGGSDGSIDLTINGATDPVTITWNAAGLNGLEDPTNLPAGTYTVDVVDAAGCAATTSIELTEPSDIVLACAEINPVSTIGGTDGLAEVSINGGIAPFEVSYTGAATGTINNISTNTTNLPDLVEGFYNIIVTDANGCTSTCEVVINGPGCAIEINISGINPSCNGNADGRIALTINNAIAPLIIDWNDPNLNGIEDPRDLPAGNYTVLVTDAAGCVATASIELVNPEVFDISCTELNPVSTPGGSDGMGSVIFEGGTSPYNLSWTGPQDGNATAIQNNTFILMALSGGTYEIIATDANGCETTCSLTITEPGCNLSVSALGTNISCNGSSDGAIDLDIQGANGNVTIIWNDSSLDGIEDPQNLGAGSYTVTITDEAGCTATTNLELTEPAAISLACAELSALSAIGADDGSAVVNVEGGTAPFSVEWTGPLTGSLSDVMLTTALIENLAAGSYDVTIRDANNCESSCNFFINNPGCAIILESTTTNVSCNGNSDGIIDLTISGVTEPLNIVWNDPNLNGMEDLVGIEAGTYIVSITDANGCSTTATFEITEPEAILLTCAELSPVSEVNATDGQAQITITGGVLPYGLAWQGPANGSLMDINDNTVIIEDLPAGDYTISFSDANGCPATCTFTITDPGCNFDVTFNTINAGCEGTGTGSIDLELTGGTPPFNFDWNVDALDGEEDPTGLSEGQYIVVVTDANGCTASATANIEISSAIFAEVSGVDPSCFGLQDATITIDTIEGGIPPYEVSLDGNFFQEIPSLPFTLNGLGAGDYVIQIRDAADCPVVNILTLFDPPQLVLDLGGDQEINQGDSIIIDPLLNFDITEFKWSNTTFISNLDTIPTVITPFVSSNYTLTAFNEFGCQVEDQLSVIVNRETKTFIPSAFSPDGDGINDILYIFADGNAVTNIKAFRIFDRWGNTVFDASNFDPNDPEYGWDGSVRGEVAAQAVYVYFAEVEFIDGRVEILKGDVTLLR